MSNSSFYSLTNSLTLVFSHIEPVVTGITKLVFRQTFNASQATDKLIDLLMEPYRTEGEKNAEK